VGTRAWLVLVTREKWRTVLENWVHFDPVKRLRRGHVKAYPEFRFYTNGTFVPFDRIRTIDTLPPPAHAKAAFYLHDESLVKANTPGTPLPGATCTLKLWTPNRVTVETSTSSDGFMVFLDNYDRFWKAWIDGKRVPIYRANFTFKTIALPAGTHQVEWVYDPLPVKLAWIWYYVTFAGFVGVAAVWRRRDRREDAAIA